MKDFIRWGLLVAALLCSGLEAAPGLAGGELPPDTRMDAAQLQLALQKLDVLGSVLYIAAHPDDENAALLSYLSQELHLRVGYLAMTRGDGGQNLIGSEKGALLGIVRTQELVAARRIDGAEQYFTRAIDFGYSKSPGETLEIWGHDLVLADVVWVIRNFRPDVIITRFPPDGGGHGHHTASAILAIEAFEAAGDPRRFPEQLEWVEPWQAKRVFWNAWRPQLEDRDPNLPPLLAYDVGSYSPLLGESFTEVLARSRSMHKTQGVGRAARRGARPDYLELLAGEAALEDPFEGIPLGWSRVEGSREVEQLITKARMDFEPTEPSAILPTLVRAYAALTALAPDPWAEIKRDELRRIIRAAAGLWLEAVAEHPVASPGDSVTLHITALSRTGKPVRLDSIELPLGARLEGEDVSVPRELPFNREFSATSSLVLPRDYPYSYAYWLREEGSKGAFAVEDPLLIGRAESPAALTVRFTVSISGGQIAYDIPVVFKWTDRVAGERYRRFEVGPPVSARFDRSVYVFPDSEAREVQVSLRSTGSARSGTLRLALPPGWQAEPAERSFALADRDAEQRLRFTLRGGDRTEAATLLAVAEMNGGSQAVTFTEIDHPHIPVQAVFLPAESRVVRVDLSGAGGRIGYVMGSGDEIPEALAELGYDVTLLTDDELETRDLTEFHAVVVGIRAFNTRPRLVALQERLLRYVHGGGRLIVQYNTVSPQLQDRIGPYPFKISRARVTVEEAEVRLLDPDHPLLNEPNRITPDDFEGWVQERGTYFSDQWDARYQTVLSSNDPGEDPLDGGLLYAEYGDGVFIYTGYAWFRELPAGVPGAYRLFVNLLGGESR